MRIFERLPLWSLFLAGFLICVLSWYPGHDWGGDFAAYLQQARVLVEGGVDTWAEDVRFTVENSDISFGPAFYGWGFPLLLAPVYAIFGLALTAYKVLMSLLLLGAGFFAWRLFRDGLSLPYTWLALAILLLSPTLVEFTNTINSDFAFLFASFGVLLMIETWRQRTLPLKWGAAIGLGVFFAAWIRPNGVLLLAPVGVVVLLRLAARDRRGMLYAAWPAMVAVGLLLAAGLVLPVDRSDLVPALARGLANPWENLLYYLEEGGGSTSAASGASCSGPAFRSPCSGPSGICAGAGRSTWSERLPCCSTSSGPRSRGCASCSRSCRSTASPWAAGCNSSANCARRSNPLRRRSG